MTPIKTGFYTLLTGLLLMASFLVVAKAVPERADIDAQFKWDLTEMYADAVRMGNGSREIP